MIKSKLKTGASWATPPGVSNLTQKVIRPGSISETELQKRLRKLEAAALDPSDTVVLTDDQYTLSENVVYLAYASALSNLVNGSIPNQSDATDFQYSPYNAAGVLMAFRGYFSSNSIYASGDPTDYTWESTSGLAGFTSSERYYTTSTGLLSALGNPTEPGSGITWTIIASGNAIPGTAVWLAERFTVSGITSGWTINAVGAYVNSSILVDAKGEISSIPSLLCTIHACFDCKFFKALANGINHFFANTPTTCLFTLAGLLKGPNKLNIVLEPIFFLNGATYFIVK